VALFEAFYNFCFVPKHTIGTQLLTVRRDKRERAAFMQCRMGRIREEDDETQKDFASASRDTDSAEDANAYSSDRCEHCGAWLNCPDIDQRNSCECCLRQPLAGRAHACRYASSQWIEREGSILQRSGMSHSKTGVVE